MPMSHLPGKSKIERRDREERRVPTISHLYLSSAFLVLVVFLAVVIWPLRKGRAAPDLSAYPWLYLRDGEPLAADEKVVELIAVGDVMLGRGVADKPRPEPCPEPCRRAVEGSQPFAAVTPWLRAADLTLGNLECVIAEEGVPRPGPYRLRALPSAVADLCDAGFDVLGLANNHALDFGPAGLAETVSRLQEAGMAIVGVGPNAEAAVQPLIRQVGGVRLAFLAFNAVPDPEDVHESDGWTRSGWDRERATAAIAAARAQADAVIVSVHWGYEYELRADPAQRDAAQAMLDAGADLVIGHHPHVVQGFELDLRGFRQTSEVSRGRFVAYSLGNFVFDQQQGETRQGLALRTFFDEQGLRAVQALPVWAGPHPRLMTPDEATSLLARVQPHRSEHDELTSRRLGFTCDSQTCHLVNVSQAPRTGAFRTGAMDLTGDGVTEQVRLEEQQVIIYRDGIETWRGLPEWRVVDLALGDPNDDGRSELVLALWKPDAAGVPRDSTEPSSRAQAEGLVEVSHPFIIGYREGAYRILWGGSAVADPIREVELGDVDGDGAQELIVLEERGDGCAVTVWRWHGWGFSLMWRSPPGRYRDLALTAGDAGHPPIISVALES
ncbi:MAG: CapA family protein [Anaerolineales bacterium]|nr:MAG: CapA family protein [Anaerolineales bacterium]